MYPFQCFLFLPLAITFFWPEAHPLGFSSVSVVNSVCMNVFILTLFLIKISLNVEC